jgi:hypothetical protein
MISGITRLAASLVLAFIGAVCGMRLLGGARPSPLSALFTNPDGTPCPHPCLFGIRPGISDQAEAASLLAAHPLTRTFKRDERSVETEYLGTGVRVSLVGREHELASIYIAFDRQLQNGPGRPIVLPPLDGITLGQVVSAFGSPTSMDRLPPWRSDQPCRLVFPLGETAPGSIAEPPGVRPTAPVFSLEMELRPQDAEAGSPLAVSTQAGGRHTSAGWHGFSHLERYMADCLTRCWPRK